LRERGASGEGNGGNAQVKGKRVDECEWQRNKERKWRDRMQLLLLFLVMNGFNSSFSHQKTRIK